MRDEDSQGIWTTYTFDAVGNRLMLTTNDSSRTNRPFDRKTLHYSYNAINQLLSVVGDTHPGSPGLKRADNSAQALHAFRHEVAAQRGKGISDPVASDLLARADALLAQLYGKSAPNSAAVDSALASLRTQVERAQANGALRNDGIATSLLAKLRLAGEANNGASGELQTVTYRYDANGNRINKEFPGPQGPRIQGSDYTYDPENRLVVVQDYQQNLQGNRVERAVTTMAHDGDGRRLVKNYDPKTGSGGVKQVEYVYDGLDPIAEYNTWNPQYENFYRGDRGRILQMHHFPSGTAGQIYWYHYDGLGSVAGMTKQQGQSSHNYRYEPYGQIELPKGNCSDPHNHYTFTGQEWNENTGLYEFYARHYDPDTGTWMSQDPYRGQLSDPQSLHRYGYVEGNPVNYWDVYGYATNSKPYPTIVPTPVPSEPTPKYDIKDPTKEECDPAKQLRNFSGQASSKLDNLVKAIPLSVPMIIGPIHVPSFQVIIPYPRYLTINTPSFTVRQIEVRKTLSSIKKPFDAFNYIYDNRVEIANKIESAGKQVADSITSIPNKIYQGVQYFEKWILSGGFYNQL